MSRYIKSGYIDKYGVFVDRNFERTKKKYGEFCKICKTSLFYGKSYGGVHTDCKHSQKLHEQDLKSRADKYKNRESALDKQMRGNLPINNKTGEEKLERLGF